MIPIRRYALLNESSVCRRTGYGMIGQLSAARNGKQLVQFRSTTTPKQIPTTSAKDVDDRPMTAMERMKFFPQAVKALYKDYGLYRTINDAAKTSHNSWHGRIPRQQMEQQRHFIESASIVGPLVMVWIPPIIGYIPMVLSIAAPRQVLSRHFQNVYELLEYTYIAHRQRVSYWENLQDALWKSVEDKEAMKTLIQGGSSDAAGIILDNGESVRRLYDAVRLPSLQERKQLAPFALAVGVYSSFPNPLPRIFTPLSPTMHLRRQLLYWGDSLATDDQSLLEEPSVLPQLSRVELTEACFRRGLPTEGLTDADLCKMLENHLSAVAHLPITAEDKGLWMLAWNILRQSPYISSNS